MRRCCSVSRLILWETGAECQDHNFHDRVLIGLSRNDIDIVGQAKELRRISDGTTDSAEAIRDTIHTLMEIAQLRPAVWLVS